MNRIDEIAARLGRLPSMGIRALAGEHGEFVGFMASEEMIQLAIDAVAALQAVERVVAAARTAVEFETVAPIRKALREYDGGGLGGASE